MKKGPTIEDLEGSARYKKALTLKYDDIAFFVVDRLFTRDIIIVLFWLLVIISAVVNAVLWLRMKSVPGHPSVLAGVVAGYILLPLALAPFHEAIHWIFLKATGARDTRMGINLRQGIIYLSAHRHVLGRRAFALVALSPFIIITAAAVIIMALTSSPWMLWVISSVIFAHATMCLGDVILLAYMYSISSAGSFTWDDTEAREAYFYIVSEEEAPLR